MSIKFGSNEFRNSNDESTAVIINDGVMQEIGVKKGELSESQLNVYISDSIGRKIQVPFTDAMIQAISLMSEQCKDVFKTSLYGDIKVLPTNLTGIVPFLLTTENLGCSTEFIIYGKNMLINEIENTEVLLIDKETGKEFKAVSWNPINNSQISATFKIPKTYNGTLLKAVIRNGDITTPTTAEVIVNKSMVLEPVELEFTGYGSDNDFVITNNSITFNPMYTTELGSDCVSVVSGEIDGTKNFILSCDLSINTKEGATLNAIDLTRSGFGLGHSDENGSFRFDDVNLDIRNFQPRFCTFLITDNIKRVKFIKNGNVLYKMMYTETGLFASKQILTETEGIQICASMQRVDADGIIKSVSYSNIKLKLY